MKQVFALIIMLCFLLPLIPPAHVVNGQTHYTAEAERQGTYHSYESMTAELEGLAKNILILFQCSQLAQHTKAGKFGW
ncbi:MAG: hypothetical protein QMC80_09195 [Thermoplasmatales archaeon]|nr:hypothetical protein [Thermoplasmatales archaeon]